MKTYNRKSLVFEKGEGVWLIDEKGDKYLDFVSGVAVNCLGHSHPTLVKTMQDQVEKLMHVSNLYWTESQLTLGKRLSDLSGLSSVFFCNSGTEALETAFKIARKFGTSINSNKSKVIVMQNAFHGRTMGALSLTYNKKYKAPFGSLMTNIVEVPFNNISELEKAVDDSVCAILLEPIQGEGGIYSAEMAFLEAAKTLSEKHNALLIFDEVQCGIGRSGELFAFQKSGVLPDVLCMAKGLGAGMPIGAVAVSEKADVLVPGDHGSTFGGNPLACCAGNVVLDHIAESTFLAAVKETSKYVVDELTKLNSKYDFLVEIRGEGLMLGVETKYSSADIVEKALEENLLLIGAGQNTVRIIPPLVIEKTEIDVFIKKFEAIICKLMDE